MNKLVVAAILLLGLGILSGSVSGIGQPSNLKTTVSADIINTALSTYVAKILSEGFHIPAYQANVTLLWILYTIDLNDLDIAPILFDIDKTKLTIDGSKNTITLKITGLKTSVTSKLGIKGGLINAKGNFTVDVGADVTLSIHFNEKQRKSAFLVSTTDCDINFSTFDIKVDGDFTLKTLGFIASLLKIIIKPMIPKTVASSVEAAITNLYTSPLIIPYELNLSNYSFLISPILNLNVNLTLGDYLKANSFNNLDIGSVAYFLIPPNIEPPLPAGNVPYHENLQNQNVAVVLGNNVLNSLFWVANGENFIGISINNAMLPVAVLNTDNFEFLFPNFYNHYGANKSIVVNLTNEKHAVVPQIKFCDAGTINMTFQANVSFLVEQNPGLEKAFVLQFDFALSVKPTLSGSNISLSVENIALDSGKQVYSIVGDLDVEEFTELLNGTLRNIRPLINYYLAKMSFAIPNISNGELKIADGSLSFAGKIALTNQVKKAIRSAVIRMDVPRYQMVFRD